MFKYPTPQSSCNFVLAAITNFHLKYHTVIKSRTLPELKETESRMQKFKTSVWVKSVSSIKKSLILLLFLLTSFADWVPRKVLLSQSTNINSFWHRKTTSLWSFRECFESSNVFLKFPLEGVDIARYIETC